MPKDHPVISEEDLIKKKNLLNPLADDDDIDWKTNPFDIDSIDEHGETPELARIHGFYYSIWHGLYEWTRVAMGLKGSGPFFQLSMANKVLAGYVTRKLIDIKRSL